MGRGYAITISFVVFHRLHSEPSLDDDGKREISFFYMGDFDGLSENLVFQRLLAQDPLELSDALLEGFDLGGTDDFFIDPDRLFPTLGHAPSPVKQQGRRNTMLPSHIGNRDPAPRGFLQDPPLLVDGIPPATLNIR
jgi:hypothetical protein